MGLEEFVFFLEGWPFKLVVLGEYHGLVHLTSAISAEYEDR